MGTRSKVVLLKGVFEEVQDFNGNGEIDDEDRATLESTEHHLQD